MNEMLFDIVLEGLPGVRFDAMLGDSTFFEVLIAPRDLRRLRAAFVEIARCVSLKKERKCVLVIADPGISTARLFQEFEGFSAILRPEVQERLTIVVRRKGELEKIVGRLPPETRESIEVIIDRVRHASILRAKRPGEAFFDVLRVLLVQWFRSLGPVTSKELREQTGFSFPTIAECLEKLQPHLIRSSDRSIQLGTFPKEAWFKLIAQSEKVRSTQEFADRSGRPRPIESLVDSLQELQRSDIAVGGILGARHYWPGIDLFGTPRLDLIVHLPKKNVVTNVIRQLDPALKPAERGELPRVAVHTLYRPVSFFQDEATTSPWADEVECLLDLFEAHLESQAAEFLERLIPGGIA